MASSRPPHELRRRCRVSNEENQPNPERESGGTSAPQSATSHVCGSLPFSFAQAQ